MTKKEPITIEANGEKFEFSYTFNALCDLEKKLELSFPDIVNKIADDGAIDALTMRALTWSGIITGRPDFTLSAAGDVIDAVGAETVATAIFAALKAGGHVGENPPAKTA